MDKLSRLIEYTKIPKKLSGGTVEEISPELQAYFDKKILEIIAAALEKSRTRKWGVKITPTPWTPELVANVNKIRQEDLEELHTDYAKMLNNSNSQALLRSLLKQFNLTSTEQLNEEHLDQFDWCDPRYEIIDFILKNRYCRPVFLEELNKRDLNSTEPNCIATATDNYGPQSYVAGNLTFYGNPEKYGFKKISAEEALPGDIIQYGTSEPDHAVILNSIENGIWKVNYSNGGSWNKDTANSYHVNSNYEGNPLYCYRFIGTEKLRKQWQKEFEALQLQNLTGTLKAQNGAKLELIELTETPNVLPTGDLHKNKHDDFGIDVTAKGIPVITVLNDEVETLPEIQAQSESVVQHAEVEKEEIIFNKELTDKIEDLRKEWNNSESDEIAYLAGLILTKEILFNTNDLDGLIDKVNNKL